MEAIRGLINHIGSYLVPTQFTIHIPVCEVKETCSTEVQHMTVSDSDAFHRHPFGDAVCIFNLNKQDATNISANEGKTDDDGYHYLYLPVSSSSLISPCYPSIRCLYDTVYPSRKLQHQHNLRRVMQALQN